MISIVIPTFNRAKTLHLAIVSILRQTHDDWELIIIDDGSVDETSSIVQPFLDDERITYYFEANKGASAARNRGAEVARGSHLIFLDSDDTLCPDALNSIYAKNIFDKDLIFWNVQKTINGKNHVQKPTSLGMIYNNVKGIFLAGSVCIKKDVFFKVGQYDTNISFGENYELGLRICQISDLKIIFIDKVLLNYEINTDFRPSNDPESRLKSHLYQLKKHEEIYSENPSAHAEMLNIIAYVFEKCDRNEEAVKYYRSAWEKKPQKLKPLIKLLYLKIAK